ncbi:MlaA family lipoprotein [Vibrio aerogenes]|nr:MlaA family lipoprotein [Vibrio aerogenes]
MNDRLRQFFLFLMIILLGGCSTVPENSESAYGSDPLESINRTSWALNYDYLDPYFFKPLSLAYVDYVPNPFRRAIANFLSNLDEPASVVNNLIMGNGEKAVDHLNRFWMNSTFGLFGLIDIASAAGIHKDDEKQFGDALGHYGIGNGPYLMLPALGPYSVRDTADFVDSTYLPLSYLNIWAVLTKSFFEGLETRAALANQESMLQNSPDPYALARDMYFQHQNYKAEVEQKEEYDPDQEELFDEYLDEAE